jgi:hypothetical protein
MEVGMRLFRKKTTDLKQFFVYAVHDYDDFFVLVAKKIVATDDLTAKGKAEQCFFSTSTDNPQMIMINDSINGNWWTFRATEIKETQND